MDEAETYLNVLCIEMANCLGLPPSTLNKISKEKNH
jgi:hypothetical protein